LLGPFSLQGRKYAVYFTPALYDFAKNDAFRPRLSTVTTYPSIIDFGSDKATWALSDVSHGQSIAQDMSGRRRADFDGASESLIDCFHGMSPFGLYGRLRGELN
jgi:hypothetical protein